MWYAVKLLSLRGYWYVKTKTTKNYHSFGMSNRLHYKVLVFQSQCYGFEPLLWHLGSLLAKYAVHFYIKMKSYPFTCQEWVSFGDETQEDSAGHNLINTDVLVFNTNRNKMSSCINICIGHNFSLDQQFHQHLV